MKKSPTFNPTYAVISAKGAQRVFAGHLWVYRSDLTQRPKVESGSVVRVVDQRGRFIAFAHFGAETEITLRILTTKDEKVSARVLATTP